MITFKQFIETFNFKKYNTYTDKEDSTTIRIYIDDSPSYCNWVTFGVRDFDGGDNKWRVVSFVLSEKICSSLVKSIYHNVDDEVIEVCLISVPEPSEWVEGQ